MTTYGQMATGRVSNAEKEFLKAVDGEMPSEERWHRFFEKILSPSENMSDPQKEK